METKKQKWSIDTEHSEIGFKIRHMMMTNISGKIIQYEALMETYGENLDPLIFDFTGQVNSISTGNTDRDKHLQSADFFNADLYPIIQFKSNSIYKVSEGNYEVKGDLSMHGVTKTVLLKAESIGPLKDPWGRKKISYELSGKLNRKDWNLVYNTALETGGVLVGEEVTMIIELQFIKL